LASLGYINPLCVNGLEIGARVVSMSYCGPTAKQCSSEAREKKTTAKTLQNLESFLDRSLVDWEII